MSVVSIPDPHRPVEALMHRIAPALGRGGIRRGSASRHEFGTRIGTSHRHRAIERGLGDTHYRVGPAAHKAGSGRRQKGPQVVVTSFIPTSVSPWNWTVRSHGPSRAGGGALRVIVNKVLWNRPPGRRTSALQVAMHQRCWLAPLTTCTERRGVHMLKGKNWSAFPACPPTSSGTASACSGTSPNTPAGRRP